MENKKQQQAQEEEVDLDEREAHLLERMEAAQRKNAKLSGLTGG
jgi:hypothetical protein